MEVSKQMGERCICEVNVEIGGKEIWLTAFKDAIESLLAVFLDISLMSNSESIEDLLMGLEDIYFTYNLNKNSIIWVASASHGLAQCYNGMMIDSSSWHETIKHVNFVKSYILRAC